MNPDPTGPRGFAGKAAAGINYRAASRKSDPSALDVRISSQYLQEMNARHSQRPDRLAASGGNRWIRKPRRHLARQQAVANAGTHLWAQPCPVTGRVVRLRALAAASSCRAALERRLGSHGTARRRCGWRSPARSAWSDQRYAVGFLAAFGAAPSPRATADAAALRQAGSPRYRSCRQTGVSSSTG